MTSCVSVAVKKKLKKAEAVLAGVAAVACEM